MGGGDRASLILLHRTPNFMKRSLEIARELENVTYVSYWKQGVTGSRFPARFRQPHNEAVEKTKGRECCGKGSGEVDLDGSVCSFCSGSGINP